MKSMNCAIEKHSLFYKYEQIKDYLINYDSHKNHNSHKDKWESTKPPSGCTNFFVISQHFVQEQHTTSQSVCR